MAKTKIIEAGKIEMEGLKKVGKGLLIGLAGYALTFIIDLPQAYDFGQYTAIITVVSAGVVNYLRKKLLPYSVK